MLLPPVSFMMAAIVVPCVRLNCDHGGLSVLAAMAGLRGRRFHDCDLAR
jgi:hypothetical protein